MIIIPNHHVIIPKLSDIALTVINYSKTSSLEERNAIVVGFSLTAATEITLEFSPISPQWVELYLGPLEEYDDSDPLNVNRTSGIRIINSKYPTRNTLAIPYEVYNIVGNKILFSSPITGYVTVVSDTQFTRSNFAKVIKIQNIHSLNTFVKRFNPGRAGSGTTNTQFKERIGDALYSEPVVLSQPRHGQAKLTMDRKNITYVPDSEYYGLDCFTYTMLTQHGQIGDPKVIYLEIIKEIVEEKEKIPRPVADFTGSPTAGVAPLTVRFTDTSTNTPTKWIWDFKSDGLATSTEQNPTYVYEDVGTYSVILIAGNESGSGERIKGSYITVNSPPPPPSPYSAGIKKTSYQGYFNDEVNWFENAEIIEDLSGITNTVTVDEILTPISIEFIGYIKIPESGIAGYSFLTECDDSSYLWIGDTAISGYNTGNSLINNSDAHRLRTIYSAEIPLTPGNYYPIRLQYGNVAGPAGQMSARFSNRGIDNGTEQQFDLYYTTETGGF